MNKKTLALILLALVLAVGLLYYSTLKDNKEEFSSESNISNNIDEKMESNDDLIEEGKDSQSMEADIAIGELAPDFTLLNLEGEEVSLSDFRGQYILINFWATWCKYCDMEMPDLDRLNEENEDLVVLAVNVGEEKELVDEYIKEGDYRFPVVLDETGDVALTYLINAFPTSYFVDKEGILLGGVPGMLTYERMNQILDGIRGN